MKTTTKAGIKVKIQIKAGGMAWNNHNRSSLKVRSGVKAGTTICQKNHSRPLISLA